MNLKNPIQLLTVREVKDDEVRNAIDSMFEEISNDDYLRYYPIDNDKDMLKFRNIINNWLISDGYYIDADDEFFHILFRFDW
jgi:hypothetical protein